MNSVKLVEARALSYTISRAKAPLPILSNINLSFEEGDFLALQGPSGSGKSTLLHVMGTLLKPTSGELLFNGLNPFALSDLQLAHFRSHEVGFIFQQFHVFPNLNLLDNILIPTWLPFEENKQSTAADIERAKEWASRLGVDSRLDHYPHQLSGGQLQRLVIARALMRKPRILFADEPTGNLDSKNAAETLKIFQKLNEEYGQSIFLVTHDQSIASEASRKLFMVDGEIVSDERLKEKSKAKFPRIETSTLGSNTQVAKKSIRDFAFQNLKKNWKRSALTMLGIFAGIASTFFLGSLGTFVQDKVIESYRDMGVSAFRFHAYPNWPQNNSRKSLPYAQLSKKKDMDTLLKVFPEIEAYSPIYNNWMGGRLVYGGTAIEESTRIYGVSKEFFEISAWGATEGKIFSHYQEKNSADICLIGSQIKKKLFPNGAKAEGAVIEVHLDTKASVCRVVGVLEDRKFGSQWDDPNMGLFVPHTSFVNFSSEEPKLMSFLARVKNGVDTGLVATSVENFFKNKYGTSGEFRADRNSMLLAQMQKFTRLMRLFLLSISIVCLLMGGVGLMNMMLVSVSERLAELGLMQALGASSMSLKKGVIYEALYLCLAAGLAGVVASFAAFHLILWITSKFVSQVAFQWHVDFFSLILSIVAIFVVALVSAILPARKAAELEIAHTLKGR